MDDSIEDFPENTSVSELLNPRIFSGNWTGQPLSHFDAVTISLNGSLDSDLNWKKERDLAQKAIDAGYMIFWRITLGLFDQLVQPLSNQTQFLSLTLSLEHFRDSLWSEFKSKSIGICFYTSNADFSQNFTWNDEHRENLKNWLEQINESSLAQLSENELSKDTRGRIYLSLFCRNVILEYLTLLGTRIPDSLPLYLCLDIPPFTSLFDQLTLLNPDAFSRFRLAVNHLSLTFPVCGWNTPLPNGYMGETPQDLPITEVASVGICVCLSNCYQLEVYQELADAIFLLNEKNIPYRLISESELTAQWDGLDHLIYSSTCLTTTGKRKLQGFCAAGGEVISTRNVLGFSQERTLNSWLNRTVFNF